MVCAPLLSAPLRNAAMRETQLRCRESSISALSPPSFFLSTLTHTRACSRARGCTHQTIISTLPNSLHCHFFCLCMQTPTGVLQVESINISQVFHGDVSTSFASCLPCKEKLCSILYIYRTFSPQSRNCIVPGFRGFQVRLYSGTVI